LILFRRILREPLLHFAALSLLLFLTYSLLSGRQESGREQILVSDARIEQLAGLFAKTWQRAPTPEELKALVDDYVAGEIYYREARRLGLDADDAVIRQRLRLKMELLNDLEVDRLAPTDDELAAFLSANPEMFAIDPQLALQQVLLSPARRGDALESDAVKLLADLRSGSVDPADAGDATLLPAVVPLTPLAIVSSEFGEDFSNLIKDLPENEWSGPIRSGYGLHLIRITGRQEGRMPNLAEAREEVVREWKAVKREEFRRERLAELAQQYDVVIDGVREEPAGAEGANK
jgi:hypothetical protein